MCLPGQLKICRIWWLAAAGPRFGDAVWVNGDVIVVGAPFDDDNGATSGSSYVFRYNPGTQQWVQEAKLLASDGAAGDRFGDSVVVRGDTVIVGASGSASAAYVFHYDGGTWNQDAKIEPSDNQPDLFAKSMAISGDTLIVGATADNHLAFGAGAAYVFREIDTIWVEESKLTASDGAMNDTLGESVDISGDLAIVGAPFDDDQAVGSGSAFIYRFDGSEWVEVGKLLPQTGESYDTVGDAVAIDGSRALVGAPGDSSQGSQSGALHAFTGFAGTDCNDNGTADDCEILSGAVADTNGNGIPDTCDLIGDVDGDGTVGIVDFLLVLGAWGPCADCDACPADLDNDCMVGITDLLLLLASWS